MADATESSSPIEESMDSKEEAVVETASSVEEDAGEVSEQYDDADTNALKKGLPSIDITTDTIIDAGKYRVFGFRNESAVGMGLDKKTQFFFEMYYGVKADFCEDGIVEYTVYSHLDDVAPVSAYLKRSSTGARQDLPEPVADKTIAINLSNQANDLFFLYVYFDNEDYVTLPAYVNDGLAYGVYTTKKDMDTAIEYAQKADAIRELAESYDVTPEKSLSVSTKDIAYPWSTKNPKKYRCDTDLWRELAHEIVPDEDLADSVKAIMLHDWMTENLACDFYKMNITKVSRAQYYKDGTGTWSVWNTHMGVCLDFAQIYAIMCREFGIPCTSISSDTNNHTWNIVYLNGEWWELDFTYDIQRRVYGEDVTKVKNADKTICYDCFLPFWKTEYFDEVDDVSYDILCEEYRLYGTHDNCIHTQ